MLLCSEPLVPPLTEGGVDEEACDEAPALDERDVRVGEVVDEVVQVLILPLLRCHDQLQAPVGRAERRGELRAEDHGFDALWVRDEDEHADGVLGCAGPPGVADEAGHETHVVLRDGPAEGFLRRSPGLRRTSLGAQLQAHAGFAGRPQR